MKIVAALLVLVGAATAVYLKYAMTLKFLVVAVMPGPDHEFDITHASMAPDYSIRSSWLAHPKSMDNADWTSRGDQIITSDSALAHVFFIHPTAYLGRDHWNGTLEQQTATDENRQWMMVNQASVYNACCRVYAPYYREASIYSYFEKDLKNGSKALDFAYRDVERAFANFLQTIPPDSPFILASHSQGTVHGQRLLQEVIDGSALSKRLVAAYLVGGTIHEELFSTLYKTVGICIGKSDIACVNAWDTWRTGAHPDNSVPNWTGERYTRNSSRWLCVNPLSWKHDQAKVVRAGNPGSMPVQNVFSIYSLGGDVPVGHTWGVLVTPLPGMASAQCIDGILRTNDMDDGPFEGHSWGGNYHSLDYALYYQSIRDNVQLRVDSWRQQQK